MSNKKKNIKKVTVLRTEYQIVDDKKMATEGIDGMCEPYTKVIRMLPEENVLDDGHSPKEKRERYEQTLRHEILHAFFFESGDINAGSEKLIEWLSVQLPKMVKAFQEAGCSELPTTYNFVVEVGASCFIHHRTHDINSRASYMASIKRSHL